MFVKPRRGEAEWLQAAMAPRDRLRPGLCLRSSWTLTATVYEQKVLELWHILARCLGWCAYAIGVARISVS